MSIYTFMSNLQTIVKLFRFIILKQINHKKTEFYYTYLLFICFFFNLKFLFPQSVTYLNNKCKQ